MEGTKNYLLRNNKAIEVFVKSQMSEKHGMGGQYLCSTADAPDELFIAQLSDLFSSLAECEQEIERRRSERVSGIYRHLRRALNESFGGDKVDVLEQFIALIIQDPPPLKDIEDYSPKKERTARKA